MLPPSMIRNVQNNGNKAPNNSAGRNDRSTSTNQVRGNLTAGMESACRTAPACTGSNNSNKNDLMQRLRLIKSQLPRSMTSSLPSNILQSSTTSSMQPNMSSSNNHTNVLRPEVPRSNVGIVAASAAVTNPNTGSNTMNAIDVDGSSSQVVNNANNTGSSHSENEKQTELFPYILHGMLDDEERTGRTNIVSWNADGKSFRVQDPDAFVTYILGKHLKKYVGGIARRYTQFRSDLKDWGFEDSVDVNCLSETFTHHCFQKGQSNLCRYMRCGRKTTDPSRQLKVKNQTTSNALNQPVLAQSRATSMPTSSSPVANANAVTTANALSLGNAAQLLLGQHLQAQAKQQQQHALQQQQQQQQNQALQLQALLAGVTNSNNPMATMSLIQLLLGQQQQQQQPSPQAMAAAAALQRQQQKIVATSNANLNNSAPQNPAARSVPMSGNIGRTSIATVPSAPSMVNTAMNKPIIRQLAAKLATQTKRAKPTLPSSKVASAQRPSASAKRAAFLNKRSKATGAAYRNPNKKQKRPQTNANVAMVMKNRKKNVTAKASSVLSMNKNGTAAKINAFTLNEDFKEKTISDLLFPWKLHDMLNNADRSDDLKTNVVSWQADGVSFNIHNKDRFVEEIIPRYFDQIPKEWDSFLNLLSSWGFVRFTHGTQKGAFIHRLLVKGKRSICKQMRINGKTVSDWMKQHGQFIGRLHALLCHAEKEGKRDIVSWSSDGKTFKIHDPSEFMNKVFPMYFDSLTYSSFEQKLRRWGFMRSPAHHQKIDKETKLENAVYSHPHFVRGKLPNLVWVKSDTKIPRTLQQHNFLVRLRVMLSDASRHGYQFVVSWAPHGKAFMIHDRPYFSNRIMPSYFKSKFTSFRQSLRNHGFAQIGGNGWDEGAYYHKLFLREDPLLCQGLTQDQMKKAMPEWIPVENEPNFYPSDNALESEAAAATMVSLKSSIFTKPSVTSSQSSSYGK